MQIDVKAVLGVETSPEVDGERLAQHLVTECVDLNDLTLDMTEVAPEELVSSFVNSMLNGLAENGYEIQDFIKIKWICLYDEEADSLAQLVSYFLQTSPVEEASQV